MGEKSERWGVFAWWNTSGTTMAQIQNTFKSKAEAAEYARTFDLNLYDSVVVVPEDHFDECWKLIGANVKGGSHA